MYEKNLAAPCGIYCGACRQYLLWKKDLLEERGYKMGCKGCRIRNKNFAFKTVPICTHKLSTRSTCLKPWRSSFSELLYAKFLTAESISSTFIIFITSIKGKK